MNTLNWGFTDDNQYTIITRDADRLKDRTDTGETCKSIKINYNPLENRDYMNLINKAGMGQEGYQLVPKSNIL